MKALERMFYVAVVIGLFIKFPWLIPVILCIAFIIFILLCTEEEEGEVSVSDR